MAINRDRSSATDISTGCPSTPTSGLQCQHWRIGTCLQDGHGGARTAPSPAATSSPRLCRTRSKRAGAFGAVTGLEPGLYAEKAAYALSGSEEVRLYRAL